MGLLLGAGLLLIGTFLTLGFLILGKKSFVNQEPDDLRESAKSGPEGIRGFEHYKQGLTDTDPKIRAASAERLAGFEGPETADLLFMAMADKNEEVRMAATAALKKLRDPTIAPRLVEALKEPNKWLPARVAEVLVPLGQAALPALQAALNWEDPVTKGYVIEILAEIGDSSSIEALHESLKDSNSNIRLQAARALGKIADKGSVVFLEELLCDPEIKVRVQAIRSLGKIGGTDCIRRLSSTLAQPDSVTQYAALEALCQIGHKGIEAIRTAAVDPRHPAREKAEEVLRGSKNAGSPKINISYEADR